MDLILGSMFEEESEPTENAGDAIVSGIPVAASITTVIHQIGNLLFEVFADRF